MSEKIYLLRETELQSLVNKTATELLVSAGERLVADGTDLDAVVALVTAVERQLDQRTEIPEPDPAPVAGFPSLPKEDGDTDASDSTGAVETDEETEKVQVDKKSIFAELKGLR